MSTERAARVGFADISINEATARYPSLFPRQTNPTTIS